MATKAMTSKRCAAVMVRLTERHREHSADLSAEFKELCLLCNSFGPVDAGVALLDFVIGATTSPLREVLEDAFVALEPHARRGAELTEALATLRCGICGESIGDAPIRVRVIHPGEASSNFLDIDHRACVAAL